MKTNNCDNTLDSLRNFKLTIAMLYESYANVFSTERKQWQSFAQEEKINAQLLAKLNLSLRHRITGRNSRASKTIHSINQFTHYLQKQIKLARDNRIKIREAVLVVLKIENFALAYSFDEIIQFHLSKYEEFPNPGNQRKENDLEDFYPLSQRIPWNNCNSVTI